MSVILSFAEQKPGADTSLDNSRRQVLTTGVIHRPQGRCPGLVGIGQSRRHSSPGTWHVTPCADGHSHQHYSGDVRCTHAAGANHGTMGYELDGYQGETPPDPLLRELGRAVLELRDKHGVPDVLYPPGGDRLWVDRYGWAGWICHREVGYPPDPSLHHYDGIETYEWVRALELAGRVIPKEADNMPMIRKVVSDQSPYRTAGGAELPKFPGAHVLVNGVGAHGMEVIWSKNELDQLLIRGVLLDPIAYNRTSFKWKTGVKVDDADHRPPQAFA